jgi:hypothetical protein
MGAMIHIEDLGNGNLNFKLKGDKREVAVMLRTVFESRIDVLTPFAAAVLTYFEDHNVDPKLFMKGRPLG